ncbi:MAG: TRAP transporter large permease subunit [Kiritimatiellia bacterium]
MFEESVGLIDFFLSMPELIILLMFSSLMCLMLTGQRVFGIMGFVGIAFALIFIDRGSLGYGFNAAIKLFNWYPMLTLPMFVFMGFMLSESGIANDMYHMFHVWFGGLRGGLAVGTLLVMIMISCMNGLSVAGMAIGCSVALPELMKRNYDKRMISGVIQAGSSLGILFPPSIVLVLYGMIARTQVKDLWLAGIGPALLLSALFFGYVVIRCRFNPALGPVLPKEQRNFSWAEKLAVLRAGILPILLVLSVIGSFFAGLTSLEESSAVGALAAFLIALFKRRLTWRIFQKTLRETLNNSAMFLWIMMAALTFSAVFDSLRAVDVLRVLFTEDMGLSPWCVLFLMQLAFIVLGIFLDDTAMLIIVAPLFIPLVKELGFSPIWFGVLYTITCQIAYITPPFGYNLFMMRAMSPDSITIKDIYTSIVPFLILMVVAIVLIMVFPQIALWLPDYVNGNAVGPVDWLVTHCDWFRALCESAFHYTLP